MALPHRVPLVWRYVEGEAIPGPGIQVAADFDVESAAHEVERVTAPWSIYRGITLGSTPGDLDEDILQEIVDRMAVFDLNGAAESILAAIENPPRGVEGTTGVWWSTDLETAQVYSGRTLIEYNVFDELRDGQIAVVLHGKVDETLALKASENGSRFGYEDEFPMAFDPGDRIDLTAVEWKWEGQVHKVDLRRQVTAAHKESLGDLSARYYGSRLDDALEELANVIMDTRHTTVPGKNYNLWSDHEQPDYSDFDWASHLSGVREVYRGAGIPLSPEDYEWLFEGAGRTQTAQQVALWVLEQVKNHRDAGVGVHWSAHRGEAAGFAGMTAPERGGGMRVILTAETPDVSHVRTEHSSHDRYMGPGDNEQEVPLKKGSPVTITKVEWAPAGPIPMMRSDDGGGWRGADPWGSKQVTAAIEGDPGAIWPMASKTASSRTLWRGLFFGGVTPEEAEQLFANPRAAIEDALAQEGSLGIHWTDDATSAYNFAEDKDPSGWAHEGGGWDDEDLVNFGVVLEATVGEEHILDPESEEWQDYQMGSALLDYGIEREVTVRDGAPVNVQRAALVVGGRDIAVSMSFTKTASTSLYRGLSLRVSIETAGERGIATAVEEALRVRPHTGQHWTTDSSIAERFAESSMSGQVFDDGSVYLPVVLKARPSMGSLMDADGTAQGVVLPDSDENETTLRFGADIPLDSFDVKVPLDGHWFALNANRYRRTGSIGEYPSSTVWERHTLPITLTASRRRDVVPVALKACAGVIHFPEFDSLGVDYFVTDNDDHLDLRTVKIPEHRRGQGIGTDFVMAVMERAEREGKSVALTPEAYGSDQPMSTNQLKRWYESLGFRRNNGSDKMWSTRQTHVWHPPSLDRYASISMYDELIDDDEVLTLYHGTTGRGAQSIRSSGIMPDASGTVFLSTEEGRSAQYARARAEESGDVPMMVAVDVRAGDLGDAAREYEYIYRGTVPASAVVSIYEVPDWDPDQDGFLDFS